MRIMIVDDEMLVRMGIKTTLDWESNGLELVGEADNGLQAIDVFHKQKPDIVLVDIIMPKMNGIEFIKKVKDISPQCRFIILSCHNEFEYMREAMKLGVRDYIMKTTIKRDELMEIIKKIAEEITKERVHSKAIDVEKKENNINRPIIIRSFLNEVIDKIQIDENHIAEKIQELQLIIKTPNLYLLLINIDNNHKLRLETDPRHYEILASGIANIAQELLGKHSQSYVYKRDEKDIVAFACFDKSLTDEQIKTSLKQDALEIIRSAKKIQNVDISIGISDNVQKLSELAKAYTQALRAIEKKFFTGKSSIVFYEGENENLQSIDRIKKFEYEAIKAFAELDFDSVLELIDALEKSKEIRFGVEVKWLKNVFLNIVFNILKVLNKEMVNHEESLGTFFYPEEILSFEFIDELIEYLKKVISCIIKLTEDRLISSNKNVVNKAIEVISQRIDKEITLNEMAEYVNMSPAHFSRLFKKETGDSFTDYIIKLKISRAKKLIRNGEKLWVIAHEVGYTEISSFSRIFKKFEGISPQKYRNNLLSNKGN